MAKIPQGILGGISGRIGNVVGGDWKGINYIRSMPLSVANPNTSAQQAQRGAFTQVVIVARLLLADLLATYWDPFARRMSGYNHFIQQNIGVFDTSGLLTPQDFNASRGILTGVPGISIVSAAGTDQLDFQWTDNSGQGDALATDIPVFLHYNVTQNYWAFTYDNTNLRSDGSFVVTDILMTELDEVECYMFFRRPDLEKISDSAYTHETIGA